MLRIRLSRVGAKKQPSYRIVVADVESKRDGRIVERIGFYNPRVEPMEYDVAEDRALYWLSVGAQPSDAVRRLLDKQGTMDRLARLRQGEEMAALVAEFTGEAPAVVESTEVETAEVAVLESELAEEVVAEVIAEVVEEAMIEEAAIEEAVIEEAAIEEAVIEEAVIEEAAIEEAMIEEAAIEEEE